MDEFGKQVWAFVCDKAKKEQIVRPLDWLCEVLNLTPKAVRARLSSMHLWTLVDIRKFGATLGTMERQRFITFVAEFLGKQL